jgi:hypothetical protein
VGRIDQNKGCRQLFDFFRRYRDESGSELQLLLVGRAVLPIPDDPGIRHLGFLDDQQKWDALAGCELMFMPSPFESLSMVTLEAWALGRPVLANARCDVLKGQCMRSNAGLYYDGEPEFVEALLAIEHNRWIAGALGRNGRRFFREHYDWPVVERKYLDMFARLSGDPAGRPLEPLPGWFDRRRRSRPPAEAIVKGLPVGPSLAAAGPATPPSMRGAGPGSTSSTPAGDRREWGRARASRRERPRRGGATRGAGGAS